MHLAIALVSSIAAASAAAVLALLIVLGRSLPRQRGAIVVDGLAARATIRRDGRGVPHVSATTRRDGYFALGFVHAQDRLWQMEMQRRICQGTLAELSGQSALAVDRFTRTLGLHDWAKKCWDKIHGETRADILAYVAGINSCIRGQPRSRLAPEFLLLRTMPREWTGEDVLAIGKLLGWTCCSSHVSELLRLDLVDCVGAERAGQMLYDFTGGAGPRCGAGQRSSTAIPPLVADIPLGELLSEATGSNLWLVSGARSSTGFPVLANDPHLGTSAPAPFYVAQVSAGDLRVFGATVPGIPAFISGRNEHIAWGVTNLAPDVQDLTWETVDPSGTRCWRGTEEEPLTISDEWIQVKGSQAVRLQVRRSSRGPLISDVLHAETEGHRTAAGSRPPLALQWTGFCADDHSVGALMAMNLAADWSEFHSALRDHVVPPLNFGYADRKGNIGLKAAGRVPRRSSHDGSVPTEGRIEGTAWTEMIPYEELPCAFNPECGYIVSTNGSAPEPGYRHFLGRDWIGNARRRRIESLVAAHTRLDIAQHRQAQCDSRSESALELWSAARPHVRATSARLERMLALLDAWDGHMRRTSVPATLFAAWHEHAAGTLVGSVLSPALAKAYRRWSSYSFQFLLGAFRGTIDSPIALSDLATGALQAAVAELTRDFGADPTRWQWARAHAAVFGHSPFQWVPALRRLCNRSAPSDGYFDTVNIGPVSPAEPRTTRHVAVYRQVIDLAPTDASVFCQCLGQSGHFLSSHYDDFLADWADGQYRAIKPDEAQLRRRTLSLTPRVPTGLSGAPCAQASSSGAS
jgi:penicillin amidase